MCIAFILYFHNLNLRKLRSISTLNTIPNPPFNYPSIAFLQSRSIFDSYIGINGDLDVRFERASLCDEIDRFVLMFDL